VVAAVSGLRELREAIEQELEMQPDKPDAFDKGAAAAYNYVLSRWPTTDPVREAAQAFLDAALLESMTKAPEYIAAKRRLRRVLRETA
jgi:hypothetical protein